MKLNKIAAQLASELEKSLGLCVEEAPKGFRTITSWSEIWGCHAATAGKICLKHSKSGRMERKEFLLLVDGRKRKFLHFRAIK